MLRALLGVGFTGPSLAFFNNDSAQQAGTAASANKNRGAYLMIKRILIAGLAMSAFAATSAMASPYNWTGFYVGIHAGGATGDIDLTNKVEATGYIDLDTGDKISFSPDGVLGGAQFGYNIDFSGWILGVEGSFAGLDFDDRVDNPFAPPDDEYLETNIDWLGTATARVGFGMSSTLFYLKGGWAISEVNIDHVDYAGGRQGSYETSETHDGWVAGAGIEHAIADDLSVALEYNYIDLGTQEHSGTASAPFGGLVTNDVDVQIHTATARLNWRIFTP